MDDLEYNKDENDVEDFQEFEEFYGFEGAEEEIKELVFEEPENNRDEFPQENDINEIEE